MTGIGPAHQSSPPPALGAGPNAPIPPTHAGAFSLPRCGVSGGSRHHCARPPGGPRIVVGLALQGGRYLNDALAALTAGQDIGCSFPGATTRCNSTTSSRRPTVVTDYEGRTRWSAPPHPLAGAARKVAGVTPCAGPTAVGNTRGRRCIASSAGNCDAAPPCGVSPCGVSPGRLIGSSPSSSGRPTLTRRGDHQWTR